MGTSSDCFHVECRIRRGELPKIALTNCVLRGEAESGWLRFLKKEDRSKLAAIFRAYRKAAATLAFTILGKLAGKVWSCTVSA